jgi:PAS domain S-box-containing protein
MKNARCSGAKKSFCRTSAASDSGASLLQRALSCSLAIIITDLNATITNLNDAFARMLGYETKQELADRNFSELCAPAGTHICSTGDRITLDDQYQRQQAQYVSRLLKTGSASTRMYLYRRDGIVMPADVTASLLADEIAGRTGVLTVCADATARLEPQQQTDFLFDIFSTARDGIYVSDAFGTCIMVNKAFCDMTGYTREDLIGKSRPSLLPDTADAALNQQILEALSRNADMSLFETIWQHKNGTVFPVEVCIAVLKSADGEDNGIVATVRDISQRVHAEKEALAAKAFLESVFTNASEGMYVTDALGHFIMVNQAFCDITGYAQEELIGRYVPSLLPFDPGLTFKEYGLDTATRNDDFSRFETRWQRRDGRIFFVEVRLAVLKNANGDDDGLVGIVCDTTERKSMEDALEARVRERTASLEEMNKALTVLLRGREEDKKALEETILANLSELIFPYLEKLKTSRLDERQLSSLSIIEANLKEIVAPFALRASSRNHALTPSELRIANLIKQGMTSKDIAQITGLSTRTIDHRRESIRNKLGITDRRTPLSSYLLSSF